MHSSGSKFSVQCFPSCPSCLRGENAFDHASCFRGATNELKNNSPDPVFQKLFIEIYKQSCLYSRQPEVCEELGFMDRQKLFHAFQFEEYVVVYNHIQTIATVKFFVLVDNGKRLLTGIADSSDFKFVTKTFFICRFKQTRSKVTVNFQSCRNNLMCSVFRYNTRPIHHSFSSCPSCLRGEKRFSDYRHFQIRVNLVTLVS